MSAPVVWNPFPRLHLENVVRLDGVQGTLPIVTDKFYRILRLAAFVHNRECHQKRCAAQPSHAMHRNAFLWLLLRVERIVALANVFTAAGGLSVAVRLRS